MPVRPHELPSGHAAVLAASPLLAALSDDERRAFLACAELVRLPPNGRLAIPNAAAHLGIVLDGTAVTRREGLIQRRLGPGDHVGILGISAPPLTDVVVAETPLTVAELSPQCWDALVRDDPKLALKLALAFASHLADDVRRLSGDMGLLLGGRALPRAPEVTVRVLGVERRVPTGTRIAELLPPEHDGELVVAALLGNKPVSLGTALVTDGVVEPLVVSHWEGRQIYAHSVGLLLLEAAHQVAPGVVVRMGPSRGTRQAVEVTGGGHGDRHALAARIASAMERIADADVPIRHETWSTEEAAAHFRAARWDDAATLVAKRREPTVGVVSCGDVYALAMGPLLPSTGLIAGFRLVADGAALRLELGARDPRTNGKGGAPAPAPARDDDMIADHHRWLAAMGVTSVGAFDDLCVTGQVAQLIRVAEGFHEKRIGRLADRIASSRDRIRIIAIAGPSSSGKSTFIKRLTVQLQIDDVNPVGIGIDDYYVDRERTPRDPTGDWDFEAIEAIDLPLLQDHVRRILAGEAVRTARFDFVAGKSHPDGGPLIQLRAGDVLMLEGIHGLNPRLLGGIPRGGELFRIFVNPVTTLPFDRLTRVSATDLRLVRRIVRDRHQRGYSAADNILRWPSVQAGERAHIYPFEAEADAIFDSTLVYEPAVLKVYAERYLLEVPRDHPAYPTAHRLRYLVDRFVSIYPDHVPPTSIVREFIGGSGFEY